MDALASLAKPTKPLHFVVVLHPLCHIVCTAYRQVYAQILSTHRGLTSFTGTLWRTYGRGPLDLGTREF